jgi:hypothetical protein
VTRFVPRRQILEFPCERRPYGRQTWLHGLTELLCRSSS